MERQQRGRVIKAAITIGVLVVVLSIAAIGLSSNDSHNSLEDAVVGNEGLLTITDFSVADDTITDTYANGTIFVIEDKDQILLKIVCNFYIEEEDISGVSFLFDPDFELEDITCSYRGETSREYITRIIPTDPKEPNIVEIALMREPKLPSGGGNGIVIFELTADKTILERTTSSELVIGLGSEKTMSNVGEIISYGIVHKNIEFQLS